MHFPTPYKTHVRMIPKSATCRRTLILGSGKEVSTIDDEQFIEGKVPQVTEKITEKKKRLSEIRSTPAVHHAIVIDECEFPVVRRQDQKSSAPLTTLKNQLFLF